MKNNDALSQLTPSADQTVVPQVLHREVGIKPGCFQHQAENWLPHLIHTPQFGGKGMCCIQENTVKQSRMC